MKQIDEGGYVYARPYSEGVDPIEGYKRGFVATEGITYRQLLVANSIIGHADRITCGDDIDNLVHNAHSIADAIITHQAKEREGK